MVRLMSDLCPSLRAVLVMLRLCSSYFRYVRVMFELCSSYCCSFCHVLALGTLETYGASDSLKGRHLFFNGRAEPISARSGELPAISARSRELPSHLFLSEVHNYFQRHSSARRRRHEALAPLTKLRVEGRGQRQYVSSLSALYL